ncbi:5-methylcytosine-specific restriction protein B [Sphingobacterium zeae]|uniref:5-methylcytosine-specific restriction protein B n=1 Tax=Sphingobacterium zeae TaxID=1776859 RepID=A0ABU0U945_9SPHI|nr:AAA family ATPase [Sphingobacterium zeae]MDQ1151198.1 5-methylcytosine-specific restriction protein B [Sphingobacterium zeae]
MKKELEQIIRAAYANEHCRSIIEDTEFYFQKAKDALESLKHFDVTEQQKQFILTNKDDYHLLKSEYDGKSEYHDFLKLLFTVISYCDIRAYRKNELNEYPDKRVLASAAVRMPNWVNQLISYKFELPISEGSVKNAIAYLEDPVGNFTMLSDSHREQLVQNLFGKSYVKTSVIKELLEYFQDFGFKVNNPQNYTHLLSRICYLIKDKWTESLIGLMVADSTGWQEGVARPQTEESYVTIWNHKKPSGTAATIKLLRECLEENGSFKIFYTSRYNVHYIAEIIDLVTDQKQLDEAAWKVQYGDIEWYSDKFEDYYDGTGKRAKIIYLARKLYKIDPISSDNFTFQHGYQYPSVGNQTPIVSYKTEIDIVSAEKSEETANQHTNPLIELLKYKKQIVLQGPPGTGKTHTAKEIAKLLFEADQNTVVEKPKHINVEIIEKIVRQGQTFRSVSDYADYEITKVNDNGFIVKTHKTGKEYPASFENIIKYYEGQKWSKVGAIRIGNDSYEAAIAKYIYQEVDAQEQREDINNTSRMRIMQFHPSFTYEDFVRGIESDVNEDKLQYKAKNKQLVLMANEATLHPEQNYVLILDEINRANLSAVLGELIYALEYRSEDVESMYSVDGSNKISLPENLYIIGTMNTADRSVGHIDYAIRRRFAFVDILPKNLEPDLNDKFDSDLFNKVSSLFVQDYDPTVDYTKKRDLLKNSVYLSAEFRPEDVWIGHSYFIKKKHATMDMRLDYEIRPLLLEYIKDGVLHEEARAHILALPNDVPAK